MKRIVHPGKTRDGQLFVKIEYNDKRLSLHGVVRPTSNGDCRGSCGQCQDVLLNCDPNTAQGWTLESCVKLHETWESWHLNDMRAGCIHQRSLGWGKDRVEVVSYTLTMDGYKMRMEALAEAEDAAREGRVANLTATERALLCDEWWKERFTPPDSDDPLSGLFEVAKRETKLTTWVKPSEHPAGVLCKPCPECGYKFGTAWQHEDVPEEVIAWLFALPETDVKPAWI